MDDRDVTSQPHADFTSSKARRFKSVGSLSLGGVGGNISTVTDGSALQEVSRRPKIPTGTLGRFRSLFVGYLCHVIIQ